MKEKVYLLSLAFLSLILVSSVLYSLHLRVTVDRLEERLSKDPDFTESRLPREYRQAIEDFINNNIEKIVTEKHMMGGRWLVTNLNFLSPSVIQIGYEDGHNAGRLVLTIDELKITEVKYRLSSR